MGVIRKLITQSPTNFRQRPLTICNKFQNSSVLNKKKDISNKLEDNISIFYFQYFKIANNNMGIGESMTTNLNNFKFKWSIAFGFTEYKSVKIL